MDEAASSQQVTLLDCPQCGSPLKPGSERCYYCRADLRPAVDAASVAGLTQPAEPEPRPAQAAGRNSVVQDSAGLDSHVGPDEPDPAGCPYLGCSSEGTLHCEACGLAYCPAHLERCHACGRSYCRVHRGRCDACGRSYCWAHMKPYTFFLPQGDHSVSMCHQCLAAWRARRNRTLASLGRVTVPGALMGVALGAGYCIAIGQPAAITSYAWTGLLIGCAARLCGC